MECIETFMKEYYGGNSMRKTNDVRLVIDFTTGDEKRFLKRLLNQYTDVVIGVSWFEDDVLVDASLDILNDIENSIKKATRYRGIGIEIT